MTGLKDQVAIAAASTTGFVAQNLEPQPGVAGRRGLHRRDTQMRTHRRRHRRTLWQLAGHRDHAVGARHPRASPGSGNPVIPMVDHVATAAAAVHAGLCRGRVRVPRGLPLGLEHRLLAQGPVPAHRHSRSFGPAPGARDGGGQRRLHRLGSRATCTNTAPPARTSGWWRSTTHERRAQSRCRHAQSDHDGRLPRARMIRWPLCLLDMDVPRRRRRRVHHHHPREGARPAAAARADQCSRTRPGRRTTRRTRPSACGTMVSRWSSIR